MRPFFPLTFPDGDLPRYRYAAARWARETSAPRLWWLKQQHDTLMQAYMNSVFLAAPILLVASNPTPSDLRPLELVGFGGWCISWILESACDGQMQLFLLKAKRNGDIATAVIGYPPYDGWMFCLWTKCRHPNYFLEWMCWNFYLLMAVPSALDLASVGSAPRRLVPEVGIFLILFYASRLLYDCLLYWTGAEPAESRSVTRRPTYQHYQGRTNVFFPMSVPFVNHHRTPGWPVFREGIEQKVR